MRALWPIAVASCVILAGCFLGTPWMSAVADDESDAPRTMKVGLEVLPYIEGELHAVSSLFPVRRESDTREADDPETLAEERDIEALEHGTPGGVLVGNKFTMLLVDGRVLARLRAARAGRPNLIRAVGLLHDGGQSMTPFRIDYRSGKDWVGFDLPVSGTMAPGVLRGD